MSQQSIPIIAFPELDSIKTTRPKTLVYLIKLLYGSGALLTIIYALSILLISPLLELQYDRRYEILQIVNERLRDSIYGRIAKRLKDVPNVLVKYKGTLYSDASIQTDGDFTKSNNGNNNNNGVVKSHKNVRFEDEVKKETVDLNDKLQKLKDSLLKLNITDYEAEKKVDDRVLPYRASEMQPLEFQVKQLHVYLEMVNEKIFNRHVKGYDFFQKNVRNGKTGGGNLMIDLRNNVKELRKHALKNY